MNSFPSGTRRTAGFTLTELLATLGVVLLLSAITVPAWLWLARSSDDKASVASVMGALAQAHADALAGKREVWVLFGSNGARAGMLPVSSGGSGYAAGPWTYLKGGISFSNGESTATIQPVPEEILKSVRKPGIVISGGVMFLPNGRIPVPKGGGGQLSITLTHAPGKPSPVILLSRATGLATTP